MAFFKTLLSICALAAIAAAVDPNSLQPAGCSPINFKPIFIGLQKVVVSLVGGILTIVKHHVGVIAALLKDIFGIITSINIGCILQTVVGIFSNLGYVIQCLIESIVGASSSIFQISNPLSL